MTLSEFGAALRQTREERGLSIENAAESLKLSSSFLRALENGEQAALPQIAFVRNFSRSYGLFLGIPKEALNKQLEEIAEFAAVAPVTLLYEPVASSSTFDMRLLLRFLLPVGLLVLVALGSYAVYANWSALKSLVSTEKVETSSLSPAAPAEAPIKAQASSPAPEPALVSPASAPAASAPAGTSPASAAPTPEAAVPAAGQTLVISAVSRCWISYAVDEEKGVERTLQKGDTLALAFKDKLRVIFGNVGGVRLTHNGKDLEKISKSGKYTLTLPQPQ
ncbi:MAG: DUF4115 domain-containing protein [Desulfovibrionaceae bacterium]|nr:DUF4115 domain-containing protein [Desulfovibrionaceae bacterium]